MESNILFMVEAGNLHFIAWARDREDAKRQAAHYIGGTPDEYIVHPLTEPGDRVTIGFTPLST